MSSPYANLLRTSWPLHDGTAVDLLLRRHGIEGDSARQPSADTRAVSALQFLEEGHALARLKTASFGNTWLRPIGVYKTTSQQIEEARELQDSYESYEDEDGLAQAQNDPTTLNTVRRDAEQDLQRAAALQANHGSDTADEDLEYAAAAVARGADEGSTLSGLADLDAAIQEGESFLGGEVSTISANLPRQLLQGTNDVRRAELAAGTSATPPAFVRGRTDATPHVGMHGEVGDRALGTGRSGRVGLSSPDEGSLGYYTDEEDS